MTNYFKSINFFDDTINLSFACISNKLDIFKDTDKASEILAIDSNKVTIPIQEHTNIVKWVTSSGIHKRCDGLVSNIKYNIILSLSVADCVPVCLFDPITGNYALVHSGWKGTYQKISDRAVKLILNKGSNIQNILVYLGPSISNKNYEVDMDVAKFFSKDSYTLKGEKYLLDIKSQIKDDLIKIGVKSKNISSSKLCTYENLNLCSYRRDGHKAGRIIFFMGDYVGRN